MKKNMNFSQLRLLALYFSLSCLLFPSSSLSNFSPIDNYLLNCGSALDSAVYDRRFVSDGHSSNPSSPLLSSAPTIPLADQNPSPNSPQIYRTARAFEKPSKYAFQIKDRGTTHMVRLHFHPFVSSNFDLNYARFHVLVDGYVVLSNFTAEKKTPPLIKEYLIWVDSDELVITFVPLKRGNFGFVNAIEVISAPRDLIADVGFLVNGGDNKLEKFEGLTKQALETVYRVNVGGPKVTPFNDTLWRTWFPDNEFFKSSEFSNKVYFSGWIKYKSGGASREVGPHFVYATARVIASTNASVPRVNMTWEFPLVGGFKYLVRLHFCDIASIALGLLNFNVYVNGYLAYENLDLSFMTYLLASPFYMDFVVDSDGSRVLRVSVGPSNVSMPYAIDGILNGVEIMKMNNSMGSLDGKISAGVVLRTWPRRNIGVLVPLLAVVCLFVIVSMIMHRRIFGNGDSIGWSKLSTDISEANLNHANEHLPRKA